MRQPILQGLMVSILYYYVAVCRCHPIHSFISYSPACGADNVSCWLITDLGSELLRTSTRVSSGFVLYKYSSLSFGSQQSRSNSVPSDIASGLDITAISFYSYLVIITFVSHASFLYLHTCVDVELLGPCYKTGQLSSLCKYHNYAILRLTEV